MTHTIVFVENSSSFEKLDLKSINLNERKIFSFDITSHNILTSNNIEHEIADRLLSRNEGKEVFRQCLGLWSWYERIDYKKVFEINGINILKIFDSMELHEMLMANLLSYFTCKKIIEKENPEQIILSRSLYRIIKSLNILKNTKINTFDYTDSFELPFDRFRIALKLGPIPFCFTVSRKFYTKLKRRFEEFVGTLLNLWIDEESERIILFLEINPSTYSRLIELLNRNDIIPVFFNHRRSAIWNSSSIKTLMKNNGKLINERKLLKNSTIRQHVEKITKEIDKLKHDVMINELFYDGENDIWEIIREPLISTIRNRLEEFIEITILASESLKINPKALVLLYATGELERCMIESSNNKIPSILIEHGYTNYLDSNAIYDASSMYSLFNDRIATWGNIQKQYLVEKRSIPEKRIILSGSPRHDDFFNIKTRLPHEAEKKTITILLPVIDTMSALNTTDTFINFEKTIIRIINKIKLISNTKLVVKLHPAQDESNNWIRKMMTVIDPEITIVQTDSVLKILQETDAVIHLDITGIGPSTTLLEAFILEKPVLNISLHDEDLPYEFIKDNACISCSLESDIESNIEKILFDYETIDMLKHNANLHVKRYLVNHGRASESLAANIENLMNF